MDNIKDCFQNSIKEEFYDDNGNYKITIDITQFSLDQLNSIEYQEPYGRNSLFFMLSNDINENIV